MDTQLNAIKLLQLGPQNPSVSVLLTQKCDALLGEGWPQQNLSVV